MLEEKNSGAKMVWREYWENPWQAKRAAAIAEAPGDLDERVRLLVDLAVLPLKKQAASLSGCINRDAVVHKLIEIEEYGTIVSLLYSDLARWLPDAGDFEDLVWLLKVLISIKIKAKEYKVLFAVYLGSEIIKRESSAMMTALLEETIEAAAAAWIRCLNGPGGDNRVWEIPEVLMDNSLSEAIFEKLSRDPRALALLLEEGRPELNAIAMDKAVLLTLLKQGSKAAAFCQEVIASSLRKWDSGGK